MSLDKSIRKSQSVRPFGPGAIMELEGQSFAVCSSDTWSYNPAWGRIEEPRIQALLSKRFLNPVLIPPPEILDGKASGYIPVIRFPRWHFCPKCRRMVELDIDAEDVSCPYCRSVDLAPMRFVMICPHGHMGDVPWSLWVHRDPAKSCNEKNSLRFYTSAESGGLESVFVECEACGQRRSLQGISREGAAKGINASCSGKQPWQVNSQAPCRMIPYFVQKGQSNLHYPLIESSIDIPPHSSWRISGLRQKVIHHNSYALVSTMLANNIPHDNLIVRRAIAAIAAALEYPAEDVLSIIEYENTGGTAFPAENISSSVDLRHGEYRALVSPVTQPHPKDNFITVHHTDSIHRDALITGLPDNSHGSFLNDTKVRALVDKLVSVTKMRLVSVNCGFSRVSPADNSRTFDSYDNIPQPAKQQPASNDIGKQWLPAIENYGEGIFFSLKVEPINHWEQSPDIRQRYSAMNNGAAGYFLLHSLSHAIMRQASFEAGYPLSSICERIYWGATENGITDMAGILIYTSGDSEGSLGGLSRMASPDRFIPLFIQAMCEMDVCSNDPLCAESRGQGLESQNLAACHACLLVPETSCEHRNIHLDRIALTTWLGLSGSVT